MKLQIAQTAAERVRADALVIPVAQADRLPRTLATLDRELGGDLERYRQSGHFDAKPESVCAFPARGIEADHVILVGLGEERSLDAERLRRAAGSGIQRALRLRAGRVALLVPSVRRPEPRAVAQALVEGAALGAYRFDKYRTGDERRTGLAELSLLASDGGRSAATLRAGAERGSRLAECIAFARDLSNEPGSIATPEYLAERAKEMAKEMGLRARILAPAELERQKMGALLAVGRGSSNSPRLIVLEHGSPGPRTGGRGRQRPTVALVGKGITFDSGGISIKAAAGMEAMKGDMSGGAAVLGALRAAAALRLGVNVVGIVAAAQNMPDGNAYVPGDVVVSASGKTIEILNTDAEGRVVLADALHYAQRYAPEAIVDIATLTGAKVVALGDHCCAVMGNRDALVDRVRAAGDRAHERAWPLPLWDEHKRKIRGDVADVKNTGGREAGPSTAGAFLSHFVGEHSWAHLDIAGNELTGKDGPYTPKGATGFGVRLLVELLQSYVQGSAR